MVMLRFFVALGGAGLVVSLLIVSLMNVYVRRRLCSSCGEEKRGFRHDPLLLLLGEERYDI